MLLKNFDLKDAEVQKSLFKIKTFVLHGCHIENNI